MYVKYVKRAFDLAFSIAALPFLFLLLLVIGPIIYIQDKGSVFYVAERLGKDGEIFRMYKFRTMKMNAPDLRNKDGSTFNSADDSRLTRIGKFMRKVSIDEIPQVINILKNEMSFIGPRPDLPEHRFLYEGDEERKLEVKPGITGYNQAYFRNTVPWKERIQNDIYYIDHLTVLLDLKVLFATVRTVLKREKVFINETSCTEREMTKAAK